jgi:excisionase family DNA binding protein
MATGAKAPLVEAERLMGHAITEAALGALGFLDRSEAPTSPATPSLLIDVDEAARLLSVTPMALRKRVERHQIPGVVRTGKRIQFSREKLLAGIAKRARP